MNVAVRGSIEFLRRMPVLITSMIITGALLGGAIAPAIQSAFDGYDASHPVILLEARVESVSDGAVFIRLSGEKLRECHYIGMSAYTSKGGGALSDAFMQRVGGETGATRPLGVFPDLGQWRIWPSDGAKQILIYAQHSCSGRLVLSPAPVVEIPGR